MAVVADASQDAVSEIARGCLAFRVRTLGRAVSAVYDRALADWGLSIAQVNLLTVVGRKGRCAPGELGRLMQMEKSTVSRNLRPLLDAGWLEAELGEGGRVRDVWLTAAGRAKLKAVLPGWRKAQAEVECLLGREAVASVMRIGNEMVFGRGEGPG